MQEWHSFNIKDNTIVLVGVGEHMLRPRISFLLWTLLLTVRIYIGAVETRVLEYLPGLDELEDKCYDERYVSELLVFALQLFSFHHHG